MTEDAAKSQTGDKASEATVEPVKADAGAPVAAEPDELSKRRSPWESSSAALAYVMESSKADAVQLRTADRVTIIALLVCCIVEVLSLSYSPLAGLKLPVVFLCDVVLGVCAVLFIVYRLGILCSLNRRQALVCWQLMMGCIFLGVFLCINVGVGIAFYVSGQAPTDQSP